MGKEVKAKSNFIGFLKELLLTPDVDNEDNGELTEELLEVQKKCDNKAEALTDVVNVKEPKTKKKEIAKNTKTENQVLNNRGAKSKNVNIEDREREE